MAFAFKIKLPVLFRNDEEMQLCKLGIEVNNPPKVKDMIFYQLQTLEPYENRGEFFPEEDYEDLCIVNQEFIVPLSFEEVEKRIDNEYRIL